MLNERPHAAAPRSLWQQTPRERKNPPSLDSEMAGINNQKNLEKNQLLSSTVTRIGGEVK